MKTEIIEYLDNDFIIPFPTETIYGLLANAYSVKAMNNLYEIKKRPKEKTFSIFIDILRVKDYVYLSERNELLIKHFMPGPVTFILPCIDKNLEHLSLGGKIGIRIPQNNFLQNLLEAYQYPLLATSANLSSGEQVEFYRDIHDEIKNHSLVFNKNFEEYLDFEPIGKASSIFDISGEVIKVIRNGVIDINEIKRCIKKL